jgi:ubiquinol-cytochrome c reductase cytochrome c subunit
MSDRLRRLSPLLIAVLVTAALALGLPPPSSMPASPPTGAAGVPRQLVERGGALFEEGCSSCHGFDARGVPGKGPSLRGAGARSADFYLRTGRMPLSDPGAEPARAEPRYSDNQIRAIVAYVDSFGGPAIPLVRPAEGSLSEGQQLFTSYCAGCHAITAEGGVATGASAPPLAKSTPTQVVEALRIGPYLMPRFDRRLIDRRAADSIARYVSYTQAPQDSGGWGIGHIGPVPEGMVAWLLAAAALLLVAWLIGERGGRETR